MGNLTKMIAVVLFMNIFMYVGINLPRTSEGIELKYHWNGDMFDVFLGGNSKVTSIMENTQNNYTAYNFNYSSGISQVPNQEAGGYTGSASGVTFLDGLRIAWAIIPTLFNIAISPLTLFFSFRIPLIVGLMIGVPYFMMLIISLFMMLRGIPD